MSRLNPIFGPLVATAMLIAGCSASPAASSGSPSTATPDLGTTAPVATAAAPSRAAAVMLEEAGQPTFPGTYTAKFQPPLTITIGHVVDLDCVVGYICRGSVDVNSTGWLDLEFGTIHGSEVVIIRLDKVYDPAAPSKLIDPPADLAAWLGALSGTAVLESPKAVQIGGIPATEFDVKTPGDLQLGPMPDGGDGEAGIGPSALRIVLVRVDGHVVLITEWLGPENTIRDGQAALDSLQPLVDSIKWL